MPHVAIALNTAWNLVNFRSNLIRALVADGHRVSGLAPQDEYAAGLADIGCEFVDIQMDNQGTSVLSDLATFVRFYRALRLLRPDVLLCYTVKPNIYATLAARLLGIPVINNVAGLGTVFISQGLVTRIVKALYRVAFRHSARVYFQNQDDLDYFVAEGLVREALTERLPGSGVDLVRFSQQPMPSGEPFRFLLVARLLYDKGIAEFVAAARLLKQSHHNVECCLLGFVDVQNVTAVSREEVDAWQQEGVVTYLGVSDHVSDEMARCHCVVLPSYREGLSRTLLEGAAIGRPLIATDVPGCRELIQEGTNGFLVSAGDVTTLHQAMIQMAELDADTLNQFGAASRQLVEARYDERTVVGRYREQITRALNG